ncbi:SubName: Full=Uncharacterized protein {ECO:0000313/EMBL:CCA67141.1} [Serendipita indica DSM 11827]|nr:SubName: Full=Uncharacterized protein {ECO:0000313/EMBL:CCA67141.1} [Serendipita indica DSM 11827]
MPNINLDRPSTAHLRRGLLMEPVERKTRRRASHRLSGGNSSGGSDPLSKTRTRPPVRRGSFDISFEDENGGLDMPETSLWHDAPLFVAILPSLGAFIFGTEYIQDIILFLCVCWYLHTCIRLPWQLYELSRPRPLTKQARDNMTPAQIAAQEALKWRSFTYLTIAIVAPFAGFFLIRKILESVGATNEGPYITYFHGTLFVLFGGVRPINHAASLLAGGTRELQGRVHHPPKNSESEELEMKVERLEMLVAMLTEKFKETELAKLEDTTKKQQGMLEVQDSFEKTAARLESGARRREKKADMAMELLDRRIDGLERQYDAILTATKERISTNGHHKHGGESILRALLLRWLDWIEDLWNALKPRRFSSGPISPNGSRTDVRRGIGFGVARSSNSNLGSSQRRRSYDAPGPNLDTVMEEELEVDPAPDRDAGVGNDSSPGVTVAPRGIRKRSHLPGSFDPKLWLLVTALAHLFVSRSTMVPNAMEARGVQSRAS